MKTVGELVVYGASGVCRIEDLREETFSGTARLYYILHPIGEQDNSRIFVPADNEALTAEMKAVLQPEELYATVRRLPPFTDEEWPSDGRSRSKRCRDLLAAGGREPFIRLIKTVCGQGRTPSASEEIACNRAAAMLYQEFSLVLALEKGDVIPFILGEKEPQPKA